jgi:hypothetical protein
LPPFRGVALDDVAMKIGPVAGKGFRPIAQRCVLASAFA